MATSINQSPDSEPAKLTLETLPPEIKDEIFSHLLLGAKVKYSTNGAWPGFKYKFHTTIMRVSKQMKRHATVYLHSQNEFALISSKFFAFEIDRRRYLPTVATGKAARTFKNPAVEATITHAGPSLCACCTNGTHRARDRATHALFLLADLEHLMRELRLTYHMWPSKPIYIISGPRDSPVEHVPVNVDTQIKLVWKVHPAHRQDLNVEERRARQTRLLAPLDFPTGSGKKVSVLGVDKDIARRVTDHHMPRILSVDAVGWDLYNLLKSQKKHLDQTLSHGTLTLPDLVHSYTDLACVGWQLNITGHWHHASVTRHVNIHGELISLCMLPFEKLEEEDYPAKVSDSWQMAVLCLVLDCLYTVMRLGLEDKTFPHLKSCYDTIRDLYAHTFRGGNQCLFPARLRALQSHWGAWFVMHESLRPPADSIVLSHRLLEMARKYFPADDQDEVWRFLTEDWEFMSRVAAGQVEPFKADFGRFSAPRANFQGLLNRSRIHNTPIQPRPPHEHFQGWESKPKFPKAELAAHIVKFADDFAKLRPEERTQGWADHHALDCGHVAFAFLNLPYDHEEEEEEDTGMPPFFAEFGEVAMLGDMSMFLSPGPGGASVP
ncbi:hypothetical protein E4T49_00954 [Aureobasidium sp. EXF-10728]|nr:hypothetical protein E4T49_00954 [Aureobasidium sp. EXF-10728]